MCRPASAGRLRVHEKCIFSRRLLLWLTIFFQTALLTRKFCPDGSYDSQIESGHTTCISSYDQMCPGLVLTQPFTVTVRTVSVYNLPDMSDDSHVTVLFELVCLLEHQFRMDVVKALVNQWGTRSASILTATGPQLIFLRLSFPSTKFSRLTQFIQFTPTVHLAPFYPSHQT